MKFMILVKATGDSERGIMPSEQQFAEMGKFNEELMSAGILVSGDGLHPSSKGVRIRFSGNTRTVQEGPFPETNELVAGYWIWQVSSRDEAIEITLFPLNRRWWLSGNVVNNAVDATNFVDNPVGNLA